MENAIQGIIGDLIFFSIAIVVYVVILFFAVHALIWLAATGLFIARGLKWVVLAPFKAAFKRFQRFRVERLKK